jgi:hypothetical protein
MKYSPSKDFLVISQKKGKMGVRKRITRISERRVCPTFEMLLIFGTSGNYSSFYKVG